MRPCRSTLIASARVAPHGAGGSIRATPPAPNVVSSDPSDSRPEDCGAALPGAVVEIRRDEHPPLAIDRHGDGGRESLGANDADPPLPNDWSTAPSPIAVAGQTASTSRTITARESIPRAYPVAQAAKSAVASMAPRVPSNMLPLAMPRPMRCRPGVEDDATVRRRVQSTRLTMPSGEPSEHAAPGDVLADPTRLRGSARRACPRPRSASRARSSPFCSMSAEWKRAARCKKRGAGLEVAQAVLLADLVEQDDARAARCSPGRNACSRPG